MSEEGSEQISAEVSPQRPAWPGVLAVLVLGAGLGGYAIHEHSTARQAADQNSQTLAALSATRAQVDALSTKLDALSAQKSAETATANASAAAKAKHASTPRTRRDDPRWKQVQGQLDAQGKQIESTQQELASARTELTGSIAHTHEELVLLEKKGERNYTEFDLDKSGNFQREGPVGLRLRKADTKHSYADLEMMVDDHKLSQKHVNIDQPVMFYTGDSKQPVELVINNVSKNHIHGYMSTAKYKPAELQAMVGNGQTGSQTQQQVQPRQKLDAPTDNSSPK
jgi:hypothetical protein